MTLSTSDGEIYDNHLEMMADQLMPVDTGKETDYDYEGFKASGQEQAANGHYPDTFKLPNHITFSTGSKYHGVDSNEGGTWNKLDTSEDGQDRWSFTPGATNFQNHSLKEMQDYFKKYEPGNVLNAEADNKEPIKPIEPNKEIDLKMQQMQKKYEDIMKNFGLPLDKK